MENKQDNYKVIEEGKLAGLLEMKFLVDKLGFGSSVSKYKKTKKGIKLLGYVQEELDRYHNFSDAVKERLDAENISEASDKEKEDMLYAEEEDCDCGCSCEYDGIYLEDINLDTLEFEDDDDDFDNDDDEVEGTYVIVYLDEDEDDDYDEDDWADEFDDFYSDSLENSIFKEMEDFVNGKYVSSTEEEENTPDKFIAGPQLYEILKDYFKQIFD